MSQLRFLNTPVNIDVDYKRCVHCRAVIMLIAKPHTNESYCWVHILFPGETIKCNNPYPPKENSGT